MWPRVRKHHTYKCPGPLYMQIGPWVDVIGRERRQLYKSDSKLGFGNPTASFSEHLDFLNWNKNHIMQFIKQFFEL